MRLDLLGYLLGALDGPTQELTKERIAADPQLQQKLNRLESQLEPLELVRWVDQKPPLGLAERTCELIVAHAEQTRVQARRMRESGIWDRVHRTGWHLVDFVVAAGIFLAASMMFFPAVANSRYLARRATCQDNLRLMGIALPEWADRASGELPQISAGCPKTGVAGIYAPQLYHAGFMTEQNRFLCPSSELANQRHRIQIPTLLQVLRAEGPRLAYLQRTMGGSYMYVLGHFERGKYHGTRLQGRSTFPIMSDMVAEGPTSSAAPVHGANGINVLFEDGHCRFIVLRQSGRMATAASNLDVHTILVSNRGLVEPGVDADDAVLAPSWVRPITISEYANGR